jgi:hypothetical protein
MTTVPPTIDLAEIKDNPEAIPIYLEEIRKRIDVSLSSISLF